MITIEGCTAVVTGAASGIGAAIARHFARHGAGVVLNSVRSTDAGEALAAELPDAVYVQGSIAEPGVPQRLVDAALDRWGRVDVLVNNAGTTRSIPHHDLEAASLDVWREIFETHVFGTWEMTRVAAPHLAAQQGNVVMITSLRCNAIDNASAMRASLSPTTVLKYRFSPMSRSCRAM